MASWLVLTSAGVGAGVLATQAIATVLMVIVGIAGSRLVRRLRADAVYLGALILTLGICAIPLLGSATGPERWLKLGPVNLYIAPVMLPLALVAFAHWSQVTSRRAVLALLLVIGIAAVLAIQPDVSQVVAFSAGVAVILSVSTRSGIERVAALTTSLGLCIAAYLRPDPLQPVSYVEGVFRLALDHSVLAGTAVLLAAVAFIAMLFVRLREIHIGLGSIAMYYLVLFVCSGFGLTPAPLIGFGAGPLLGYGLMIAGLSAANTGASARGVANCTAHRLYGMSGRTRSK